MKCPNCQGTGKIKENNLEERQLNFASEVSVIYFDKYKGLNMYDGFIAYWTEPNKSKTKMRFELERTWDTKRRLQTWIRNDKSWNKKDNVVGGKKEKKVWEGNYMDSFK